MCRYFVTLYLYNPSLYHIIVLDLRACRSLGTSPMDDTSYNKNNSATPSYEA